MKIKPNTLLDAADLNPFSKGRSRKAGSSAATPFKLSSLAPLRPGVSGTAIPSPESPAKVHAADTAAFKPGHPDAAAAARRPLKLDSSGRIAEPRNVAAASNASQHDQLTAQTQKWVAQTFFGTLLKQMGDSPFKSELFSGGRGGEAFSSLYHQQLADRMAHASGTKLVNSIVKGIENKQAKDREAGVRVQGAEKKAATRSSSEQDPRTKAYERSRPPRGRQSTVNLAA
jgi:Rod binding domain-containing protein